MLTNSAPERMANGPALRGAKRATVMTVLDVVRKKRNDQNELLQYFDMPRPAQDRDFDLPRVARATRPTVN